MKPVYKSPRWTKNMELHTWPEDTEYMISRGLTFKKDQGEVDESAR